MTIPKPVDVRRSIMKATNDSHPPQKSSLSIINIVRIELAKLSWLIQYPHLRRKQAVHRFLSRRQAWATRRTYKPTRGFELCCSALQLGPLCTKIFTA